MIQVRFIQASLFALILLPVESLAGTVAQLEVSTPDATYQVTVDQGSGADASIVLLIKCVERCNGFSIYKEKVGSIPLGLFRLTDAYPLLMTTWSEGTSTKVRIYSLSRESVQLVFNEYSLGTPTITPEGGVLSLSLPQYLDDSGAGSHRKVVSRTWTWKTDRFILNPR